MFHSVIPWGGPSDTLAPPFLVMGGSHGRLVPPPIYAYAKIYRASNKLRYKRKNEVSFIYRVILLCVHFPNLNNLSSVSPILFNLTWKFVESNRILFNNMYFVFTIPLYCSYLTLIINCIQNMSGTIATHGATAMMGFHTKFNQSWIMN